jgi:hypothetical protein
VDRYSNGRCKPCQKKSKDKYRHSDKGGAKTREYQRHYNQSNEGRAKKREHNRKQRQTAIGRQRLYAGKIKHKKTKFEFSLKNQQKKLTQCSQKLTQPSEIS